MRARFLAILSAMVLVVTACQAATPSASAPPPEIGCAGDRRAHRCADRRADPEPTVAARPSLLRVSRISDFLPSIHPVQPRHRQPGADGRHRVQHAWSTSTSDEVTILPDLATTWTASPDATTYTFKLNPTAVWSDGQPVTADDVIFTIAWADPEPECLQAARASRRGSTSRVATPSRARRTSPRACKKIDDQQRSRSRSTAPDCDLPPAASPGAVYYIQPKHILEGPDCGRRPRPATSASASPARRPGTGPYDFTHVDLGDRRRLHGQEGLLEGQGRRRSRRSTTRSRSPNVSVAQLAAGELDLDDPRPAG